MNTADPVFDVMSQITEKRNEQEQEKEQRYIKNVFYCILFSFFHLLTLTTSLILLLLPLLSCSGECVTRMSSRRDRRIKIATTISANGKGKPLRLLAFKRKHCR